jgi:hypothetical protein
VRRGRQQRRPRGLRRHIPLLRVLAAPVTRRGSRPGHLYPWWNRPASSAPPVALPAL